MYFLSPKASRVRLREAQNARNNRAEIIKALSIGQITRRDLYKWGLLTFGGLALKNGLSPFAPQRLRRWRSDRYAAEPVVRRQEVHPAPAPAGASDAATADPRHLHRPRIRRRRCFSRGDGRDAAGQTVVVPHRLHRQSQRPAIQESGHRERSDRGPPAGRGLCASALERVLPQGRLRDVVEPGAPNTRFHPNFPAQQPNSVWTYGAGRTNTGGATAVGTLPPFLIKGRYGEPILTANLQQHAGRPRAEQRLRPQREPAALPQRA